MISVFHGLSTAAREGLRGFNGGWFLVTKPRVKKLTKPT